MKQRSQTSIVARVKREFPDHRIDTAFPICLPVYQLRLRVTVLVEHKLSTAARFVLQLVDLDVSTPSDICSHLGLSETQVLNVAAELIGSGLVVQRTDLGIKTTEKGRQVLNQNGLSMRPQNRHPRVPYDPLTRRIVDIEIDSLIDKTTVRKYGLYVTPTRPRRPTLNQVEIERVRRYCGAYSQRKDDSEILDISAIKDVKLRYRQDILLFRLLRTGSVKPTFRSKLKEYGAIAVRTLNARTIPRSWTFQPSKTSNLDTGRTFFSSGSSEPVPSNLPSRPMMPNNSILRTNLRLYRGLPMRTSI